MAEKIFNTRILNKIDTLENWNNSTLPIKKGEICIATVAATAGTELSEPVLMIKVGEDGVKTFKELPWNLYARSSDVAAWAKAANKPTYAATEITGIADYIADYVSTEMGIEVDTDTQYQIVKVDDYNYKLQCKGKGEDAWADVADSAIVIPNDTEAIENLSKLIGGTAVAEQISTAITNLKLADTYAAKSHTHSKSEITDFAHNHEMVEINGLSDEFAKKVDKESGKSLVSDLEIARLAAMKDGANKVEASETNGNIKIDGVETTVYTHPEKHAMSDITGLDTALAGKQDVIAENTYDTYGSAAKALEDANKYTDSELERLVGDKTVSEQIADLGLDNKFNGKVDKVEGKGLSTNDLTNELKGQYDAAYAHSQVAHAPADAQKNIIESVKVNGEALTITDKAVDITMPTKVSDLTNDAGYLTEHQDISGKADKSVVDTLVGDDSGKSVRAIANEELAAQLIPENAKEAYDTLAEIAAWIQQHPEDAAEINRRLGVLEGVVNTDSPVSEQIATALDGALMVAGEGETKVEKYALATALAATNTEVAKKANDADLAAIAKTGSTDDLVQGDLVLVFDCGDSTP